MGSLKDFVNCRSAVDGKVNKWLTVLDEAGFTLEELERLEVGQARAMRAVLHPAPATITVAENKAPIPPMPKGMSDSQQLARWQWIYQYKFGITLDVSKVVHGRPKGMARQLLVAADLAKIVAVCESLFGMWFWDKVTVLGTKSVRTCANGPYITYVRDRQEADEENRDRRTDSFGQDDCITLEERLLYEIVYFLETGLHLDKERITLCVGSRYSDGTVPGVVWSAGNQTVDVYWYNVGDHNPSLAVRSAVSLEPFASNPSG